MNKTSAELMQPIRQHMETYLNDWIGEYNTGFADRLRHVSSALYRMEEELERCEENELARLVHSGADSIEKICGEIGRGDARDVLGILERQGHEHPAGALLASMAAGFLTTRAIRHGETTNEPSSRDNNEPLHNLSQDHESGLETDNQSVQNRPDHNQTRSGTGYSEGGQYEQDKS